MNGNRSLLIATLAVATALVAAWHAPRLANSIQDDGFIYFRIAQNAAAGNGPVFNPAERVDAATSPVWVWILAAVAVLGIPLHLAAAALGLLAITLGVLASGYWALELTAGQGQAGPSWRDKQRGNRVHPFIVGILAVSGAFAVALDDRVQMYAYSGMETALCAATWVWATRALVRRWVLRLPGRGAGWWALAAALVRPEFVLVAAGIAGAAILRSQSRRSVLREVGITLAPAVMGGIAYLGAHALYFGDPLPNTYYAKRASGWQHASIGLVYAAGFVRAYPWVALVPVALASRSMRPVALVVCAGLLLFTAHVVRLGGDHFEFHRMFMHVLPICAALAGAGAARIFSESYSVVGVGRARRAWRSYTVAAAAIGMLLFSSRSRVREDPLHWVQLAARLGPVLAETYPPDTRVGLFALGATGYTSGLPVVDALGIADKHVARQDLSGEHVCHLDIGHERGDPPYVLANADVVVLFAAYSPIEFESLLEVQEGFYSHKKFLAAAQEAIGRGEFVLRNIEFMPGVHWAVLERVG